VKELAPIKFLIMELRKAQRKLAKIKMGIQGPSGSGKTYSSLLIAFGLCNNWTKIAIIDTENHSADLYSQLGSYNVLSLEKPYTPESYIEAIDLCVQQGMEVVIIDSVSHEWEGQGGILEIHGNMMGNSFTNWNKVTPRHNAFVQKLIQSPVHVIGTIRVKQDYVLNEKNGKLVPEKVGLKGITRDGLDYEFTIMFEIDMKHSVTATKDRTGLYSDKLSFVVSPNTGKRIKEWCLNGPELESIQEQITIADSVDELRKIYNSFANYRQIIEPRIISRKKELESLKHRLNGEEAEHGTGKSQ
jgi:hypothetical protein